MIAVTDVFMSGVRPSGLQRGRGGFLRGADDAPWVSDPSGDIVKSGDRRGEVKRTKYGSPSGAGRLVENDVGLTKFKQRNTLLGIGMDTGLAEACRDLAVMDADSDEFKTAADKIAVEADKLTRSWLAADRGSHGHAICEAVDRGEDDFDETFIATGRVLGLDRATQYRVVVAWTDMVLDNGLDILAVEASCVDDRWRLAGTLDRIVRTTRPLTFVKSGGEIVTIPANTVVVLDIKFGKCRKAHPIQIASYAQSVPYDTGTEVRGVWPWPIDQTHALIAHGDFGGDGVAPTINLVWVDLAAGREHGGETVVQAKAWAARDDVFSVSQLSTDDVYEVGDATRDINEPWENEVLAEANQELGGVGSASPPPTPPDSTPGAATPAAGEGTDDATSPAMDWKPLREPEPTWTHCHRCNAGGHTCPGCGADLPHPGGVCDECSRDLAESVHATSPATSPIQQARDQIATNPSQGADLSAPEFELLWAKVRHEHSTLPAKQADWVNALSQEARRHHLSFHTRQVQTERSYHLAKALVTLACGGGDNEILRALLAPILGDVAFSPYVGPGWLAGSLDVNQAARLAALADQWVTAPIPA